MYVCVYVWNVYAKNNIRENYIILLGVLKQTDFFHRNIFYVIIYLFKNKLVFTIFFFFVIYIVPKY